MAKVGHSHLLKQPGFGTQALDDVIPHTLKISHRGARRRSFQKVQTITGQELIMMFVEAFFTGNVRKDPVTLRMISA